MDTTWFAVDADGSIGRFESSEDGAVPRDAASAGGAGEPSFDTWPVLAASAASWLVQKGYVEREAFDEAVARKLDVAAEQSAQGSRALVLLWIKSDDARADETNFDAEKLIDEDNRWVIRARRPRIIATRRAVAASVLDALSAHPEVGVMLDEHAINNLWWESSSSSEAGLFVFEHEFDGEGPGAYRRSNVTTEPIAVGQLPEETQRALRAVNFPIKFNDTTAIHLADHLADRDCETWNQGPLRQPRDRDDSVTAPPQRRASVATKVFVFAVIVAMLIGLARVLRG